MSTKAWTAADYDSYEVLASLGTRRPAARVNRARAARPVRRAIRAALRTARARRLVRLAARSQHQPAS